LSHVAKYRIVYKNTSVEAPEGEFLIGRSQECHLVLSDPSISRVHMAIINEGGKLYAEDRGSRNGVRINDRLVEERVELKDGDKIAAGRETIQIVSLEVLKNGARPFRSRAKETMTNLRAMAPNSRGDATFTFENRQILMMTELAHKAIRVGKLEEAERLLSNALTAAEKKLGDGLKLTDGEINSTAEAIISLAGASKSSELVSKLFGFHLAAARLMSRDLVEMLYEAVRLTKYRACKEMARYLSFLDTVADKFDASERFVHRRLKGLVKICS
jgi:pSer/pThr/pTyr-binding forkhead associated (FHA) protein